MTRRALELVGPLALLTVIVVWGMLITVGWATHPRALEQSRVLVPPSILRALLRANAMSLLVLATLSRGSGKIHLCR